MPLRTPAVESANDDKEARTDRSALASRGSAASGECHAPDAGDAAHTARAEEEEITPEMIEAGVYAFQTTLDLTDPLVFADEVVRSVYTAMAVARSQKVPCRFPRSGVPV
jgi:hypothetical protein